ncbi:MAG: chromosome segregation SMC family protein [Nitrososphaerota archaeon]
MVYIKRITIQGFKSFGSKRVVIKPEKGFVVITGPNGGGKSNVLDAIKFSLGELSNNALRVGKLSDLIHENNGRRLGQATVTLALDNTDRALPIDADEVTISRTILSSGESVYRVNGKTVSRNELLSILASANIRPSGFNIITQGAVLSIAEKSPEELRRIIDEVAGVSEFDRRKAEAMKELEVAEKNVAIARAGLNELRSRVKQLEVEMSRLSRNQLISRYLSQLRRQKLLEELRELDSKVSSLEDEERLLEGERARVSQLVENLLKERQDKLLRAKNVEAELAEIQNRISSMRLMNQSQGTPLESLKSSIRSEGIRYSKMKLEILESSRSIQAMRLEINTLEEEYGVVKERYQRHVSELEELERLLKELKDQRSGLLDSLKKWRETVSSVEAQRSNLAKELSQIEAKIALTEQKIGEISQRMAEDEKALDKIRSDKGIVEAELDHGRALLEDLSNLSTQLNSDLQRLSSKIRHYEDLNGEAKGRVEDLLRLRAEVEGALEVLGIGEGVNDISKGCPAPSHPKLFRLRDSIQSLSTTLPKLLPYILDYLDALIVERDRLALALARVAAARGVRLSVISLEGGEDKGCSGDKCLACNLAGKNTQLKSILHSIFPRHVLGTDGWLESEQPTITQDGIHYNGHGLFQVLTQVGLKRRLERLKAEVEETIKTVEGVSAECTEALSRLREEYKLVEGKVINTIVQRQGAEARLRGLSQRLEELQDEEKRVAEKIKGLRNELANLESLRNHLYENLERVRGRIDEIREPEEMGVGTLQTQLEDLNSQINVLERKVGEVSTTAKSLREQLERIENRRNQLVGKIGQIERDVERLWREAEDSKKRLASYARLYLESWRKFSEKGDELGALSRRVSELLKIRGALGEELAVLENSIEKGRQELLSIESRARNLAVARVELTMRRNSVFERLSSMTEPPLEDLSLLPPELKESVEKELEVELSEIGMVNQLASIQYSEQIVEYRGRSGNVALLEEERRKILEILEMLDAKKLEVFMKTFSRISEGFGKYFFALTGGSAWLEFSDPDEPLQSGVEMVVAFPGKSPRPSRSISGGEKSVAAVALLMAFQGLTPVDFLIMDEVDAHMDANYSKNLASLLKEFSKRAQVIAVSLKDVIAEKGDQLIGVYNQEGESRIVVTRLEES